MLLQLCDSDFLHFGNLMPVATQRDFCLATVAAKCSQMKRRISGDDMPETATDAALKQAEVLREADAQTQSR